MRKHPALAQLGTTLKALGAAAAAGSVACQVDAHAAEELAGMSTGQP